MYVCTCTHVQCHLITITGRNTLSYFRSVVLLHMFMTEINNMVYLYYLKSNVICFLVNISQIQISSDPKLAHIILKVLRSRRAVFCCSHDLSLTRSHSLPRLDCYNEHSTGMVVTHWAQRDNGLPQPGRHSKPRCYQTLSNLSPWDSRVFPAPTWPDQTQHQARGH